MKEPYFEDEEYEPTEAEDEELSGILEELDQLEAEIEIEKEKEILGYTATKNRVLWYYESWTDFTESLKSQGIKWQ